MKKTFLGQIKFTYSFHPKSWNKKNKKITAIWFFFCFSLFLVCWRWFANYLLLDRNSRSRFQSRKFIHSVNKYRRKKNYDISKAGKILLSLCTIDELSCIFIYNGHEFVFFFFSHQWVKYTLNWMKCRENTVTIFYLTIDIHTQIYVREICTHALISNYTYTLFFFFFFYLRINCVMIIIITVEIKRI